jgi:hypothetical protein
MSTGRKFTRSDLAAIRATVEKSVAESVALAVPKAMHAEFLKLGLATEEDDDQLAAQADFRFLRRARQGAEAAEGLIGKRALNWLIGIVGAAAFLGLGAFVRGQMFRVG